MKSIFRLLKTDPHTGARAGELTTNHGSIPTPAFMPVGSQGSIKALTSRDVEDIGFPMILSNMYHLYLRPGIPVIEKMGGLHKFMGWDRAILTDSGGFQIFSLARLSRVSDDGVVFRSHIDGSEHLISPELAINYQEALGVDIMMVLDECSAHGSKEQAERAMDRTHRWAELCRRAWKENERSLFAIVQGGTFPDLRRKSAEYLVSLDFPGYALGGLSIGEAKQVTWEIVGTTLPFLPEDKPRYLMGVGSPEDLLEGVARGIDVFDCVLPTRIARNGSLFTKKGRVNIRNSAFNSMAEPVDAGCACYTCLTFSAAYLHHLFNARELLAYRLATIHNLTFIYTLIQDIRKAILTDTFTAFKDAFLAGYKPTDEQTRIKQKEKWLKAQNQT